MSVCVCGERVRVQGCTYGVQAVAEDVVHGAIIRERSMPRFVPWTPRISIHTLWKDTEWRRRTKAPPSGEGDALPVPIHGPERPLDGLGCAVGHGEVCDEALCEGLDLEAEAVEGVRAGDVADGVVEGLEGGLLVEVLGDGGVDLCEGRLCEVGWVSG